jgi:hypothetical protein
MLNHVLLHHLNQMQDVYELNLVLKEWCVLQLIGWKIEFL